MSVLPNQRSVLFACVDYNLHDIETPAPLLDGHN